MNTGEQGWPITIRLRPRGLRRDKMTNDERRMNDYGLRITKMMMFSAASPAHSGQADILNPGSCVEARQSPSEGGSSRRSAVPKPERKSNMLKKMVMFAAASPAHGGQVDIVNPVPNAHPKGRASGRQCPSEGERTSKMFKHTIILQQSRDWSSHWPLRHRPA